MNRRRSHRTDRPTGPRLVPPLPDQEPTSDDRMTTAINSDHWSARSLRELAERVGGVERLRALHPDPLVPSDLDPDGYTDPLRAAVRTILDMFAGQPPWTIDAERRAILHRLIELLADRPDVLCSGDPARTAASLVWLVERSLDTRRRPDLAWVWSMYGVPQSSGRAHELYRALGFAAGDEGVRRRCLADPDLIPSRERRRIISHRDALLDEYDRHKQAVEAAKPIRQIGNGQIAARGRAIRPVWAAQGGVEGGGRRMVLLAVDRLDGIDDVPRARSRAIDDVDEVISLSIPDAWTLLRQLQRALACSATVP